MHTEQARVNRIRLLLVAVLIPLFGWAMSSPASGHDGQSSVIFLDIYPDGTVEGTVEHPYELLNEEFGFELVPDESSEADIEATQSVMFGFNTESLIIEMDGERWPITFTDTAVVPTENTTYAGYNFVVDQTFDEAPRIFDVTYTGCPPVTQRATSTSTIRRRLRRSPAPSTLAWSTFSSAPTTSCSCSSC